MKFPDNQYEHLNLYSNFAAAAETFPEVAIYSDSILEAYPEIGTETTYQGALASITQRAQQLHQQGIGKGDKVIIFKSSRFDTYLLALSVSYLGAVPVMISHHFPAEVMVALSQRLEEPWLIYDAVTEPVACDPEVASVTKGISVAEIVNTTVNQAEMTSQAFLASSEISYITHTSGTTGIPKLIAHSAESMGWRTKWQRNVFDLITDKKLMGFHISPVHSRFNIGISSAVSKGFPLLNISRLDEASVKETLTTFKPYALETHPNNFVRWSRLAQKHPELFAATKYFHSTFDAINAGTMARFLEASADPDAKFMQVYGQSECGPMILKFHDKESVQAVDSRDMGHGMPNLTEVKIVSSTGEDLPAGEKGNILMLSKGRALTYYKEDQRFADNVYDLWWDSGDYGFKNEKGELFLLDRQVDLIDKVDSNLAIEDLLLNQLDFLDEVVIVRDSKGKPQPIIALAEGAAMNWDEWWAMVESLPFLNEPILMAFEDIPRTATMKVRRLFLEQKFIDGTL